MAIGPGFSRFSSTSHTTAVHHYAGLARRALPCTNRPQPPSWPPHPCACVHCCAAAQSIRREAPRLGGSFANWGLAFSLFDCSLQYVRKKVRLWRSHAVHDPHRARGKPGGGGGGLGTRVIGIGPHSGALPPPPIHAALSAAPCMHACVHACMRTARCGALLSAMLLVAWGAAVCRSPQCRGPWRGGRLYLPSNPPSWVASADPWPARSRKPVLCHV